MTTDALTIARELAKALCIEQGRTFGRMWDPLPDIVKARELCGRLIKVLEAEHGKKDDEQKGEEKCRVCEGAGRAPYFDEPPCAACNGTGKPIIPTHVETVAAVAPLTQSVRDAEQPNPTDLDAFGVSAADEKLVDELFAQRARKVRPIESAEPIETLDLVRRILGLSIGVDVLPTIRGLRGLASDAARLQHKAEQERDRLRAELAIADQRFAELEATLHAERDHAQQQGLERFERLESELALLRDDHEANGQVLRRAVELLGVDHFGEVVAAIEGLRSKLDEAKRRAEEAAIDRELRSAQVAMLAGAVQGGPTVGRDDPRWTPAIQDALRLRHVLDLSDHYQSTAMEAEERIRAVRVLIEENGCDCPCDHHPSERGPDCEVCLACRIGEALGK